MRLDIPPAPAPFRTPTFAAQRQRRFGVAGLSSQPNAEAR